MDASRIARIPIFADLSEKQRRQLAQLADEVDVEAGRQVVKQGERAYEFFLIENGAAEVKRDGTRVAELGPGDFFGEMGSLEDLPRNADVVTTAPTTAVVLTARDFRIATREIPAFAACIRRAVEERSASTS